MWVLKNTQGVFFSTKALVQTQRNFAKCFSGPLGACTCPLSMPQRDWVHWGREPQALASGALDLIGSTLFWIWSLKIRNSAVASIGSLSASLSYCPINDTCWSAHSDAEKLNMMCNYMRKELHWDISNFTKAWTFLALSKGCLHCGCIQGAWVPEILLWQCESTIR